MKFIDVAASERFRGAADATMVLKRPENIRLIIQVPVAKTKLAEMVSDAQHFKVAVYYDKYKRFLLGTNNADYTAWRRSLIAIKKRSNPLLSMRALFIFPTHFWYALAAWQRGICL